MSKEQQTNLMFEHHENLREISRLDKALKSGVTDSTIKSAGEQRKYSLELQNIALQSEIEGMAA